MSPKMIEDYVSSIYRNKKGIICNHKKYIQKNYKK